MASQNGNYNNMRPPQNQQPLHPGMSANSASYTPHQHGATKQPNHQMQNQHQQGIANGYRTPPAPTQPRMSAPIAHTNNHLKGGPVVNYQQTSNLSNPVMTTMHAQNGVHHPRASAPLTQLGTPTFSQQNRPPPVSAPVLPPSNSPMVRQPATNLMHPSPTNSLPPQVRPAVPNSISQVRPAQHPPIAAQPPPIATQPPPIATQHPPIATQHPPIATQQANPNIPIVNSQSSPPGSQNHLNQTPSGIASGKRRAYPQQVAPSIPTSYNKVDKPSTVPQSLPNQPNQPLNGATPQADVQGATNAVNKLSVEQTPTYPVNLLEQKQLVINQNKPVKPAVSQDARKKPAHPDTMRCTFNAIPQTSSLLKQSKLPFGIYIHPFKEDDSIPIVSSVITRCRSCRSYLNPFVSILDQRRWQCNMCYRINDIPEELSYDYNTRQYCDIRKRPELISASIEFIAPSEYMLRPPQPSVYLFVLDVSFNAISTGYLEHTCQVLAENIDKLPGDLRMMIGFVTFNTSIHFYSLKSSQSQPQMFVVTDLEDLFLPAMDGLLVNVKENKAMVLELLESLPGSFSKETDTGSATGSALTAARKMVASVGGRITLFQSCIPSIGPGKLLNRDKSASSKDTQSLTATTDYYKKLALECAGEQIAIDIFVLAGQYIDLASLSCAARYSSGGVYYFPEFHGTKNPAMLIKYRQDFKRYLTRPIGFEAVMRLRCTKGMNIHTFHGNFFVRSTDLLSLPNVSPDHSFSMQIDIEDSLTESNMVAFQGALLYTTTKGERRIRVHTLSLPVTSKLSDVYTYADQEAIVCALSRLAVDRTLMSSLGDAREALMNACIDFIKVYKNDVNDQRSGSSGLIAPYQLRLIPLYILALMKNDTFKLGGSVPLDARLFSLLEFKWQPIAAALLKIYPKLYSVLQFVDDNGDAVAQPPVLQATAERLSRQGVYLMHTGKVIYLFVGRNVADEKVQLLFNVPNVAAIPDNLNNIPVLENPINIALRKFIEEQHTWCPLHAMLVIIREDHKDRLLFLNKLIDDRTESSMSYHEFLQHIHRQCVG